MQTCPPRGVLQRALAPRVGPESTKGCEGTPVGEGLHNLIGHVEVGILGSLRIDNLVDDDGDDACG